jgi:hypothetical protein
MTKTETLLPLDTIVFTPTTFRHTKRLPIRISRPSHKKFHFKKFYNLVTTHLVTRNIQKLIVNWNRTALLITSLPVDEKFTAQLNSATGSKNITCAPINQKTATNPNPESGQPPQETPILGRHHSGRARHRRE